MTNEIKKYSIPILWETQVDWKSNLHDSEASIELHDTVESKVLYYEPFVKIKNENNEIVKMRKSIFDKLIKQYIDCQKNT